MKAFVDAILTLGCATYAGISFSTRHPFVAVLCLFGMAFFYVRLDRSVLKG